MKNFAIVKSLEIIVRDKRVRSLNFLDIVITILKQKQEFLYTVKDNNTSLVEITIFVKGEFEFYTLYIRNRIASI